MKPGGITQQPRSATLAGRLLEWGYVSPPNLEEPLIPGWQGKAKEVVNLWRDVSAAPVAPPGWKNYTDYWNGVRARVVERLDEQRAGLDRLPY